MAYFRKVASIICIFCAMALLLGLYCATYRPIGADSYDSVHPSSTMKPLFGFSDDCLVNTGDAEALDILPGVGEVISVRMVEMRDSLGGYRLAEDLMLVKGVGNKTLEKIMAFLDEPLVPLPELDE